VVLTLPPTARQTPKHVHTKCSIVFGGRHSQHKAIEKYEQVAGAYREAPDTEILKWARGIASRAWLTFVSGLLLSAFKSPADKGTLRAALLKHIALLAPAGLDKTDLPAQLRERCDLAIRLQIKV